MAEKITKEAKESLKFIKQAYLDGNQEVIDQVEILAGIPVQLGEKLLEIYNSIGDTPLETPVLHIAKDDFKNPSAFLSALSEIMRENFEVNESEYQADEYISFLMSCHSKVNDFMYRDGTAKTTPLTENQNFLTLSMVNEVKTILEGAKEATSKTIAGFDADIDEADEFNDALKEIDKEFKGKLLRLAYKATGVKAKGLSEWEKDLLRNTLINSASISMKRSASWRSL